MKVLVVCVQKFNGHELWVLLKILLEQGLEFEVVSTQLELVDEVTGEPTSVRRTIQEVSPKELGTEFQGLAVVSGDTPQTCALWNNPHLLRLIGAADALKLPCAAICCASPALAPIAKGKKVSFFPLIKCRIRMEEYGAVPSGVALCRDGHVLTAEYQMVTGLWAAELCAMLLRPDEPSKISLHPSGYVPQGRPRRNPPFLDRVIEASKASKEKTP